MLTLFTCGSGRTCIRQPNSKEPVTFGVHETGIESSIEEGDMKEYVNKVQRGTLREVKIQVNATSNEPVARFGPNDDQSFAQGYPCRYRFTKWIPTFVNS
jgi:hypothetical protein